MHYNDQVLATFDHHAPNEAQVQRIQTNRASIKAAAAVVLQTCPTGADRDAALRHLHEAMMTANKAIANEANSELFAGNQQVMGDQQALHEKLRAERQHIGIGLGQRY